jgi:hypothetical protein
MSSARFLTSAAEYHAGNVCAKANVCVEGVNS